MRGTDSSEFKSALHSASRKQDTEPESKDKKQDSKDSSTDQNKNAVDSTQIPGQAVDAKPLLLAHLGFSLPVQQAAPSETSSAETQLKSANRAVKASDTADTLPADATDPLAANDLSVPALSVALNSQEKNSPALAINAAVQLGAGASVSPELDGAGKTRKNPVLSEKPSGSLAFAMRITTDEASGDSPAIQAISGAALLTQNGGHNAASAFAMPEPKTASEHSVGAGDGTIQNFQNAYSQALAHQTSSGVPASEKATAVTGSEIDDAPSASTTQAVTNLNVQLTGENNQRVDVRLTDRGGALQVSVRSADANLTQALQDKMPELTSRLEAQHMNAQVWTPRSEQSTSSDANANGSGGGQYKPGDNRSANHPGDQSGSQRNGQDKQKQPSWLDEFD